ncbi:MAG: autotransporter-associated beta strand repeat-containing protein, partial [Verrucomicrobiales bacterium]|nr:autotransporter-associated beta strand repeat-containing protein [Verrucomicrobiales bacterium]
SITNNSSIVDIGSSGTSGTLAVIGNNVSQANLTTSKVINLGGTTGGATILANQTGTSPGLILNANWTATAGSSTNNKTVTLGGTNTAANTINGIIPNNNAGGLVSVTKIDPGTWVLAGANTYTGNTTISNGTLRVKANAAASTIIADASSLVFNTVNVYAGGTFEFVGQAGANNVESLGALTPTNGSGTIKLTPGSGGTASLIFASLGTVGGGG